MASLWLILPALLTAFVIGNAYQWLQAALAKLCQPFEEKQSILVTFGAACIFLFCYFNAKITIFRTIFYAFSS